MQTNQSKLSNGLRVITVETESFPSFTALLLIGSGSRYETPDNNGIAHFLEHMVFKGTEKYANTQEIASLIEGVGGVFNAFTDKDHTGYWIKAPVSHFDTVVDVLSEMITKPTLSDVEIEREKGVIIEEMNMYEDMPARKVSDVFEEQLYAGTSLGYDIIGTKRSVTAASRQTFLDMLHSRYVPSNAVLVLAGGFEGSISQDTIKSTVEQKFGSWKDQSVPEIQHIAETMNGPALHVVEKKTEQAHFCVGFRTFAMGHPQRYALSVLSTILGGGMSSRLFTEVRERRGLCYYISTGREMYADAGNIVTQAGVATHKEKIQEALNVTLEQYKDMTKGNFTDQEIVRAKEMIKGRMVLSFEDSYSIAAFYGIKQLLEHTIATPEEIIQSIEAVTKDDITAVAETYFTAERLQFVMIGPFTTNDITIEYN